MGDVLAFIGFCISCALAGSLILMAVWVLIDFAFKVYNIVEWADEQVKKKKDNNK